MARPSSFGRDTGLQIRMLVTIFLLGAVYAVLIGVLFAAGASGITILLVAGGLLLAAVLHLRQARAALDGRPRGLPAGRAASCTP